MARSLHDLCVFFSDFKKSSVSHIFTHCVVEFLAISIYLISPESHWHRLPRGCNMFSVQSLKNAQERFNLIFQPLISPIFHTFSVNSQNTFLLADFCMVYMFSFDSNMFSNYCGLKNNIFWIKIMSYVNILHTFLVRRKKLLAFLKALPDFNRDICKLHNQLFMYNSEFFVIFTKLGSAKPVIIAIL